MGVKMTFTDKVIRKVKKVWYCAMHPTFVKKYANRISSNFTQEDLEYCVVHLYEYYLGKKLNLSDVKTFNEKLNWLKCYYHDPRMTTCADKVTAPAHFMKQTGLGIDYIVKNIGIYDRPDEIDIDMLPKEFVVKSNWGSGKQIIVRDKNRVDFEKIKNEIKDWNNIETNHYFHGFEYGYKNIIPKIICEEFINFEYKMEFFCFDGDPCYFWTVFNDKTDDVCADFYDAKTMEKIKLKHGYPNSNKTITIPEEYQEMFDIACKLSKGFPVVRIDFFKTKDSFKFSEMTFYHWCGFMPFEPDSMDLEFGKHIKLPEKLI